MMLKVLTMKEFSSDLELELGLGLVNSHQVTNKASKGQHQRFASAKYKKGREKIVVKRSCSHSGL